LTAKTETDGISQDREMKQERKKVKENDIITGDRNAERQRKTKSERTE
jgi:hypothetical protein